MYATFERRTAGDLATRRGYVRGYTLTRLGDDRVSTLVLWRDDPGTPEAYLVEHDLTGPTAGTAEPEAASIVWFDGPFSPARLAAARYGFEARVGPALRAQPGLVRALVLWRERDAASCAVTLCSDLAALEAAGRAVNTTALLPAEDPALLTGPDRVDVHHVTEGALS
jgi:hypothetical protein